MMVMCKGHQDQERRIKRVSEEKHSSLMFIIVAAATSPPLPNPVNTPHLLYTPKTYRARKTNPGSSSAKSARVWVLPGRVFD